MQKAVSNSEEAATSLLEQDKQIACMIARNREEKDDQIACMVTEMNKKVSSLKAKIQEGLAKNREVARLE